MKTFKFTSREGKVYRVKFYDSGVYTITDKNGEHELGIWEKKPMLVGKYNRPSKDRNSVVYFATSFALTYDKKYYKLTDFNMRDLASKILNWEARSETIEL